MTSNEPESANRWATEHYGFVYDTASVGTGVAAADLAVPPHGPTSSRNVGPRSRRRTGLIASAVLSVGLILGIGGVAAASSDGPEGGGHRITQFDGGVDRGDAGDPVGGHS